MTPSRLNYEVAFTEEASRLYPSVTDLERRLGFAIDGQALDAAARVLACPVKKNPPCWQHGRVLYAAARRRLAGLPVGTTVRMLDIGTAKGFSAWCLQRALDESGLHGLVTTVDVLDPTEAVRRNTIAEVDGLKTLDEILSPFDPGRRIVCLKRTGAEHLEHTHGRLHAVFVDGKHTGAVVLEESRLIAGRQEPGDLVMWDDVHLGDVRAAVEKMAGAYAIEWLQILPQRAYAIGVRR